MKIGILGTGNMGSILIEAFIDSSIVEEKQITIYNRTLEKAKLLQTKYSQIKISSSPKEVINNSQLIFVCVKPGDMYPLFLEIKEWIKPNQCVVSITSPISVEQIESALSCNTARLIPSITNKVLSGVSLLTFGASCSEDWKLFIRKLADHISEGIEIKNNVTRVSSDIVSCGPAFFSYLAQAFIDAAVSETEIDFKEATDLTEKMLIGLGDLLKSGEYSLPTLQEKVCVKGGITGEGIKVMENELGNVFKHLFHATHQKFEDEISKIEKQFQHDY
jgi:competence protein ComER